MATMIFALVGRLALKRPPAAAAAAVGAAANGAAAMVSDVGRAK